MLAGDLGSVESAGQAARTGKFTLTAIIGGRGRPAVSQMIEPPLDLFFSLVDFWGVVLEKGSCNGERYALDHR